MPKEKKEKSLSFDRRCKASPYSCSSSRVTRSSSKIPLQSSTTDDDNDKEWGQIRCPVCMEHPHNAVLLICSSYDKGCRPYMCDTSYRHSNCLDQFKKSFLGTPSTPSPQQEDTQLPLPAWEMSPVANLVNSEPGVADIDEEPATPRCENLMKSKMVCPLCRGDIVKWTVVEPARIFMNGRPRSCSCETCNFCGTYNDLRNHARVEHPTTRPTEADPERERNWRRLERQRDIGDLLSTLQSSFGEERSIENIWPMDDGNWLTVLLFIRIIRPSSSNPSPRRTRPPTSVRRRSTRLWGESHDLENVSTSRDEDTESSDGGSRPLRTYRPSTPDDEA
ncbi:hypothetical protein ACFE04_002072 [Oxalis oulophora]